MDLGCVKAPFSVGNVSSAANPPELQGYRPTTAAFRDAAERGRIGRVGAVRRRDHTHDMGDHVKIARPCQVPVGIHEVIDIAEVRGDW